MQRARVRRLKSRLRRNSKITLSTLAIALFVFNFKICDWLCGNDMTKWWFLKSDIMAICFCLTLIASKIRTSGLCRIVLSLGIGWSVSDVVDRVFFDIRYFTMTDVIMLIITIIYATYEFIYYSNK